MIVFLKCTYFQLNLTLPRQIRASMYHQSQRHAPPSFFYPHTFSLPLSLPLFIPCSTQQIQKLCRHSNSCRLWKLPKSLPFFSLCVPSDIQWILFWCGNTQSSRGGEKRKKRREVGREVDVRGTTEQSSRAERGEEGLEVEKAWWPDSQPKRDREKKSETESKHRQGRTQENSQPDNHADT